MLRSPAFSTAAPGTITLPGSYHGRSRRNRWAALLLVALAGAACGADEEQPGTRQTLAADGRVGKIADVQGIVSLKHAMDRRWTPLSRHMLLSSDHPCQGENLHQPSPGTWRMSS